MVWQVGAQVRREVDELDINSKQRPALEIVFPGRRLLTDVVVSRSQTASAVDHGKSIALIWHQVQEVRRGGVTPWR